MPNIYQKVIEDIAPLRKAKTLSRIYDKDTRVIELILRNSDGIPFIVPIHKLAKAYGKLLGTTLRMRRL
ncbi:MAG: hypothetical protein QXS32_09190 [Candidatus Nezhaarchaeales archaeon]